jgi:CRISPR-associated protein Cas6
MGFVDLSFRVVGQSIPLDNGYALYSAISRVLGPELHGANGIGIFAIRGLPAGDGLLRLDERSWLRIRTHTDHIPRLLTLAGRQMEVDGHLFRIGVPMTYPIVPAATLISRAVVIKLAEPRGDGEGDEARGDSGFRVRGLVSR